jgi:hypothetical protein
MAPVISLLYRLDLPLSTKPIEVDETLKRVLLEVRVRHSSALVNFGYVDKVKVVGCDRIEEDIPALDQKAAIEVGASKSELLASMREWNRRPPFALSLRLFFPPKRCLLIQFEVKLPQRMGIDPCSVSIAFRERIKSIEEFLVGFERDPSMISPTDGNGRVHPFAEDTSVCGNNDKVLRHFSFLLFNSPEHWRPRVSYVFS